MRWCIGFRSRELLLGVAAGPLAPLSLKAGLQGPPSISDVLKVNDLDRLIWREELDEFVPNWPYDMHTQLTRKEFNLDPRAKYEVHGRALPAAVFNDADGLELLDGFEALLYPGRKVSHLLMPNPFQ